MRGFSTELPSGWEVFSYYFGPSLASEAPISKHTTVGAGDLFLTSCTYAWLALSGNLTIVYVLCGMLVLRAPDVFKISYIP